MRTTPPPRRVTVRAIVALLAFAGASVADAAPLLPWREAGWSEREAAAHLLDRLTFGARPGEVDRVVAVGLDRWVEQQLSASLPEPVLERELARLPAQRASAERIAETYPPGGALLRLAEQAGVIDRDDQARVLAGEMPRREAIGRVEAWMEREGYRPERDLVAQLLSRKLYGALLAESQLREVLVDFWTNHFHVSLADNPVRTFVFAYERDAIRPQVLGSFRQMLGATARHPAMLLYLDNYNSTANPGQPTTLELTASRSRSGSRGGSFDPLGGQGAMAGRRMRGQPPAPDRPNRPRGLNENYARELLELHTLGVDGGYTQDDVVAVARAFSGWTVFPRGGMPGAEEAQRRYARVERAGGLGFVRDGMFVFRADAHDAAAKTVLGTRLPAGGGIGDGERVLDLLAVHPATARHLAAKLAARFVADDPPPALVERLAGVFAASRGDLAAVTRALIASPEFWDRDHRGAKIKSPFEAAVSALRALDAEVTNPLGVLDWVSRMGQPLYAYAAPTGYPDRADFWVNTGSLLGRMNFGLELASGRVPGVRFDLAALTAGREPESAEAALAAYGAVLLPERELGPTVERLARLVRDPALAGRVAEHAPAGPALDLGAETFVERMRESGEAGRETRRLARALVDLYPFPRAMARAGEPPSAAAGVVGLLLGAPEFQRR